MRGGPGDDQVYLPNPETSQMAWWMGAALFGPGAVFGAVFTIVGLWQGIGVVVGIGIVFLMLFVPLFGYLRQRSLDDLVLNFGGGKLVTHRREVPFDRISTVRLTPEEVKFGRGTRWTWRAQLEEDGRKTINLGTGSFPFWYPLLHRLAAEFDCSLRIEGGGPAGDRPFVIGDDLRLDSSSGSSNPPDSMTFDERSGTDASVEWTYIQNLVGEIATGAAMALVCGGIGYLTEPAIRGLFAGLNTFSSALIVGVFTLLCVILFATMYSGQSKRFHQFGRHAFSRNGRHLTHVSNIGTKTSWTLDDVETVVRMENSPWTGVIVAGEGRISRLPVDAENSQQLNKFVEKIVRMASSGSVKTYRSG